MLQVQTADCAYFYDNTETDVDPFLMFRVVDGKMAKIYRDVVPWAKEIVESLPQG